MVNNNKLNKLIECAILIAIGTILAQIKIYRLPNGGSVTAFSMVPFIIATYRHGTKWGLLTGLANGLLQMILGGVYPPPAGTVTALIISIFLDYILAYMVFGLADFFAKPFKETHPNFAYVFGAAVCMLFRFLFAFLSGWLIWGEVGMTTLESAIYSIGYNGSYILPEAIITCLGIYLIKRYIPNIYTKKTPS